MTVLATDIVPAEGFVRLMNLSPGHQSTALGRYLCFENVMQLPGNNMTDDAKHVLGITVAHCHVYSLSETCLFIDR